MNGPIEELYVVALTLGGIELVANGYERKQGTFAEINGRTVNVDAITWQHDEDWGAIDGYRIYSPDGFERERRELGYVLPTSQVPTITFGPGTCFIGPGDVAPFLTGIASLSGVAHGAGRHP